MDFLTNLFLASARVRYVDPFVPEWEILDFPERKGPWEGPATATEGQRKARAAFAAEFHTVDT